MKAAWKIVTQNATGSILNHFQDLDVHFSLGMFHRATHTDHQLLDLHWPALIHILEHARVRSENTVFSLIACWWKYGDHSPDNSKHDFTSEQHFKILNRLLAMVRWPHLSTSFMFAVVQQASWCSKSSVFRKALDEWAPHSLIPSTIPSRLPSPGMAAACSCDYTLKTLQSSHRIMSDYDASNPLKVKRLVMGLDGFVINVRLQFIPLVVKKKKKKTTGDDDEKEEKREAEEEEEEDEENDQWVLHNVTLCIDGITGCSDPKVIVTVNAHFHVRLAGEPVPVVGADVASSSFTAVQLQKGSKFTFPKTHTLFESLFSQDTLLRITLVFPTV
jgi:hypothetical protein